MNNKIFLKIGWMFILGLLIYLAFVIFYLSPKINTYLKDLEMNNARKQFDKIVRIINTKSLRVKSKEKLINDVKDLLATVVLGDSGYIYIIDENGKVIVDSSGEIESEDLSKLILPNTNNILLIDEIKRVVESRDKFFVYYWNRISDINNYTYKKISWVDYNKDLGWYIVSSTYKEDFLSFISGVNSFILNISILLFIVLAIIAIYVTLKIVAPLNKMFSEVKKAQLKSTNFSNSTKSKDEIGFLTDQFATLTEQVELSKKSLEEHISKKTKEIQDRLYYDELTSLRNRIALEDDIKDNDFVSLTFIDIDSFDNINELYGFSTGNIVLIEVGKVLMDFSKKYGVSVYRIYGNVFALADMKMMAFSKFNEFIEDLSVLFKNRQIHIEQLDIDIFITITLGISIAQEEALKTAGIALKKAKKNNQPYFVYNNEMDTKNIIEKSMKWQRKIKIAIKNSDIIPFYQPIFNRNQDIVKYEVLMRIKDENDEGETIYLSPYHFFDVAIKTKQYLELSNQIIGKALENLSKTTKLVSLNLSFKDILDIDFIVTLDKNLDKIDSINKEKLVFEILESDYISDYTILEEFIEKYRKQGIKIAIDDFGTGYSNFAHILKIRPDFIKIDGSLIKNINIDKNSYEMVKSIIEFTKALHIKVVAEYVHSKEVFDTVLDLGVDEFQGFFLAKPQIIENFD